MNDFVSWCLGGEACLRGAVQYPMCVDVAGDRR